MLLLSSFVRAMLVGKPLSTVATKAVSTVVRLGDLAYYLHSFDFDLPSIDDDRIAEPCTVLTLSGQPSEVLELESTFDKFGQDDDVWSPSLISTIVVQIQGSSGSLTQGHEHVLRNLGTNRIHELHSSSADVNFLSDGPYFLHHGHLHQAYRLYPDTANSFMVSTVPAQDNAFRSLDASAYGDKYPSALTVAVPSRLYYKRPSRSPMQDDE